LAAISALAKAYDQVQPDSLHYFAQQQYRLAQRWKNDKALGQAYLFMGYWHHGRGENLAAEDSLRKGLALSEASEDLPTVVLTLNMLGLACYAYQEKHAQALAYFQRCIEVAQAIGDRPQMSRTLSNIGLLYNRKGEYAQALVYYERSLKIAKEEDLSRSVAIALLNIGVVYVSQGDYDQGLDYYQRSLEAFEEIGSQVNVAYTLYNMGSIYDQLGDKAVALSYYERSLEMHQEIDNQQGVAEALSNIGRIYEQRGDYPLALTYYQRSMKIFEEIRDKKGTAIVLDLIGGIYGVQGDAPQALAYFERSLQLYEEIGDAQFTSALLSSVAITQLSLEQDSQALASVQASIALAQEIENRGEEAFGRWVLGEVEQYRGNYEAAEQSYRRSLVLSIEIEEPSREMVALVGLAEVAQERGAWPEAKRQARSAYNMAQQIGDPSTLRDAAEVLWRSEAALGDSAAALRSLLTVVEATDSISSLSIQKALASYKYELKAEQDSLENAAQQAEIELAYQQQLTQRNYWLFAGVASTVIVGLILFLWQQRRIRQRELQAERARAARLQQIDRLKDQFLANTSHELRTPLNGIIGITEGVLAQNHQMDAAERQVNLGMVVAAGKRLASLVNDLLDFSRLRNADLQLRHKPVDLRTLTDLVLQVSYPLTQGKPVQLQNEVPVDLSAAWADEDRLSQILHNLVGNAVKFTEQGHVRVLAGMGSIAEIGDLGKREDQLVIAVQDTGIGIPAEKQEVIFAAFEQADGSISRQYSGTGLGLSITKQLVEAHGGKLGVVSKPGEGSIFWFTLPVSQEKASQVAEPARLTPLMAAEQTNLASYENLAALIDDARIRLLIVDDEPINHQVLKNHLRGDRFELVSAMNGREALAKIKAAKKPFDLVLLDLMMPGMSGFEVAKKIREDFLPSVLPIIMITAKNQVADLVQGLNHGANDYLAKPFSKDEFLARLNTHVNLGQINRATERFVPNQFIRALGKASISEVRLGDSINCNVTVFFSDIRGYTTLAEQMTPEENFAFVNAYAGRMGPIIELHHGFVNQYLGDGIMALFQQSPDDALRAAIEMQRSLSSYNQTRAAQERSPIQVGMGLHLGPLIMGIIGDTHRTDAATVSDTVNIAARLESLTKRFGATVLLSGNTRAQLAQPEAYHLRYLGRVQVKGRQASVQVWDCFDGDAPELRERKQAWQGPFALAVQHYAAQKFSESILQFQTILAANPEDRVVANMLAEAKQYLAQGVPEEWVS